MEINHEILDVEPEWIEHENADVNAGRKDYWSNFIMANLMHGFTLEQIGNLMIHPATGLHATPSQLRAAFPMACQPDAGLAMFTAEVFNTARYGERGDKTKAQQLIADRIAGDKWRAPTKRIAHTVDGAIEHKHKIEQVDKAMDTIGMVLDGLATRKKKNGDGAKLIENKPVEVIDVVAEPVIQFEPAYNDGLDDDE